jgi:hypothetical protein
LRVSCQPRGFGQTEAIRVAGAARRLTHGKEKPGAVRIPCCCVYASRWRNPARVAAANGNGFVDKINRSRHIGGVALPRVQPIIPTRRKEPFDNPDWLFDFKYDGFRGLCYLEQGRCRVISRNGNLLNRFEALGDQMAAVLDVDEAIIDGEVIMVDGTGRPQFYERAPPAAAGHSAEGIADRLRGAIRHRPRTRTLRADVHEQPRRDRRETPGRSVRHARPVAKDQEPGLFAEGRQGRAVQWATATAGAFGRLMLEIKRLVPSAGGGSRPVADLHHHASG